MNMSETEPSSDATPVKPRKIALVFNVKHSHETDSEAEFDSPATISAIADIFRSEGHQVFESEADENLAESLKRIRPDLVFNIAEGLRGRGREAEAPAVCNLLGIPFVGSDETALCISMDKALCKELLRAGGIRSPKGAVLSSAAEAVEAGLHFPLILKPDAEGSSKGIPNACIAETPAELDALWERDKKLYDSPLLAEEYIAGREFTVGLLGNGPETRVFAPMEIAFRPTVTGPYRVYSYDIKQDYQKYIEYICPAKLTPSQDAEMRAAALKAFLTLGCHDFARADFRMDENGRIYFIEINPLPGLAPGYSDYPMLAEANGLSHRELVLAVLHAGMRRLGFL